MKSARPTWRGGWIRGLTIDDALEDGVLEELVIELRGLLEEAAVGGRGLLLLDSDLGGAVLDMAMDLVVGGAFVVRVS